MNITRITTSFIEATFNKESLRIEGEAYLPGFGSPSFVASLSTLRVTQEGAASSLTSEEVEMTKSYLTQAMQARNQTIEFEP